MENLGYYNGRFGLLDEMTVPFNDRVHFFGDGVYEAGPAHNHRIFALEEHIDRMFRSAAALEINIPHTKAALADILTEMVKKVDSPDQFVYWQVSRGTAPRDHVFSEGMQGNLWISLKPAKLKDLSADYTAITAEDTRFFHCNIKTLNLIPAVMYSQAAKRAGVYETILYRKPVAGDDSPVGGCRITECAHSNVHIINERGALQTAPTDRLILPGIARAHIIKACHHLGIPVEERPFTVDELMGAKEVLISSASALALRCTQVDGRSVGGLAVETVRAIQSAVMEEFLAATEG